MPWIRAATGAAAPVTVRGVAQGAPGAARSVVGGFQRARWDTFGSSLPFVAQRRPPDPHNAQAHVGLVLVNPPPLPADLTLDWIIGTVRDLYLRSPEPSAEVWTPEDGVLWKIERR